MAPAGYVGISPECFLGYNKNQGEEVSLCLRTNDLRGFRKYESMKLTLLHELVMYFRSPEKKFKLFLLMISRANRSVKTIESIKAHMVHSNHGANFHALNKKLNEETMSLDWTKSRGRSLGGFKVFPEVEDEEPTGVFTGGGQKLGGSKEYNELGARSAAALAASLRLFNNSDRVQDDSFNAQEVDIIAGGNEGGSQTEFDVVPNQKPDPDDHNTEAEPEPDEAVSKVAVEILTEPYSISAARVQDYMLGPELDTNNAKNQKQEGAPGNDSSGLECRPLYPKPILGYTNSVTGVSAEINSNKKESGVMTSSLPVKQQLNSRLKVLRGSITESAGEDSSLKSMQEYTEKVCQRLQGAIDKLEEEASPSEAAAAIQSLFKIVRNIKEHPQEDKFKRLRKANVVFQNRVARFKGAMELLHVVGFSDGPGNGPQASECLILKRHDLVLLWLAEASLEACIIA